LTNWPILTKIVKIQMNTEVIMIARIAVSVLLSTISVASFSTTALSQMAWFDGNGRLLNPSNRTICGENDMIGMEKASKAYQQAGRPVGLFMHKNRGACTGAMISKDLFLTARHCATTCDRIRVKFGYFPGNKTTTYKCSEIVEKGGQNRNQDYMIIRLAGEPGKTWGWYGVSSRPLPSKLPLLMIHHPSAKPMKISKNECAVYEEKGGMLHHRCDTMPGSSGSSILLRDARTFPSIKIVGVHGYGGCGKSGNTSSNSGPSMNQLVRISPILKAMAVNERQQLRRRYQSRR
jgi:V8-like Glu-specific endopeptidase